MRLTRTHRTSPFLFQIIPLLDILFAVLVFFVLTATFVSQPGITVELPTSNFTVEPALHNQIISIVGNNIFFRDQLVSQAQLDTLLSNKKDTPSATLIVKADRAVPYERVMTVTNLALERGYRVVMAGGMMKPATH
ncbi:MAG: biopolymer transporter ExbD [Chthoniobacterales bacterium]